MRLLFLLALNLLSYTQAYTSTDLEDFKDVNNQQVNLNNLPEKLQKSLNKIARDVPHLLQEKINEEVLSAWKGLDTDEARSEFLKDVTLAAKQRLSIRVALDMLEAAGNTLSFYDILNKTAQVFTKNQLSDKILLTKSLQLAEAYDPKSYRKKLKKVIRATLNYTLEFSGDNRDRLWGSCMAVPAQDIVARVEAIQDQENTLFRDKMSPYERSTIFASCMSLSAEQIKAIPYKDIPKNFIPTIVIVGAIAECYSLTPEQIANLEY